MHEDGQIFTATLLSTALSTGGPHDLLALLSTGASQVEVLRLELQQISTAPQAMSVELFRGSTANPGGSAITPANMSGWPSAPLAKSGLNGNSSTPMSTASAVRIAAGGFGADSGKYVFEPAGNLVLSSIGGGQRAHVRVSAPGAAVPIALTMTFAERGRIPSS